MELQHRPRSCSIAPRDPVCTLGRVSVPDTAEQCGKTCPSACTRSSVPSVPGTRAGHPGAGTRCRCSICSIQTEAEQNVHLHHVSSRSWQVKKSRQASPNSHSTPNVTVSPKPHRRTGNNAAPGRFPEKQYY